MDANSFKHLGGYKVLWLCLTRSMRNATYNFKSSIMKFTVLNKFNMASEMAAKADFEIYRLKVIAQKGSDEKINIQIWLAQQAMLTACISARSAVKMFNYVVQHDLLPDDNATREILQQQLNMTSETMDKEAYEEIMLEENAFL